MLKLAPPFNDRAVLQRDQPIPVWGVAERLVAVRVALRDQTGMVVAAATVAADSDGRWMLRLPPRGAGGPYALEVAAGADRRCLNDVLIGEVWLAAGQSNMEMSLAACADAMSPEPCSDRVRFCSFRPPITDPPTMPPDPIWQVADAEAQRQFSAIAGSVAYQLHRALGVPVGIILIACGGTRIQAWSCRESLWQEPETRTELAAWDALQHQPEYLQRRRIPDWGVLESFAREHEARAPGAALGWHESADDDQAWPTMPVPTIWQDQGLLTNGIVWFRRTLAVPSDWSGRDLELHLGRIEHHDDTWVNGTKIGATGWETANPTTVPRRYRIPGHLVGADGRLLIAVRVRSHCFAGGITGPALWIAPVGSVHRQPLNGPWGWRIETDYGLTQSQHGNWGPGNSNTPAMLFDTRVQPLIPYGMRGVLWYQGESNVGQADLYRRLLLHLIREWRRRWCAELPFATVQLAPYHDPDEQPEVSERALLREAQAAVRDQLPLVGLAITTDVGEPRDVHPRAKQPIAVRLARWILATVHGHPLAPQGPMMDRWWIDGTCIRVQFRFGQGLRTRDASEPRVIAIAGADRRWHWAQARIDEGILVAWHPQVQAPVALRFAWSDGPFAANLVNADDLPVEPFRTDGWPT